MNTYHIEYTDTFAGEANYCWVKRHTVTMPELIHYGYDGSLGYAKAYKAMERQLIRRAKALVGLTGIRCKKERQGGSIALYPQGFCTVLFID